MKNGATHDQVPGRSGRRPLAALKWDLAKAAIEFGTDPRTLLKKLEQNRQYPNARGKYSTRQLLDAIYDESYKQRNELLKTQTEKLRLQNEARRAALVPAKELDAFSPQLAVGLRPVILGVSAPDQDKRKVFDFLAALESGELFRRYRSKKG